MDIGEGRIHWVDSGFIPYAEWEPQKLAAERRTILGQVTILPRDITDLGEYLMSTNTVRGMRSDVTRTEIINFALNKIQDMMIKEARTPAYFLTQLISILSLNILPPMSSNRLDVVALEYNLWVLAEDFFLRKMGLR